jgi:hypothetical protein
MSNINPYNIDGTFPIAGQDNDSQGFRDNFTNAKNNFIFAASEISDLQAKAITISALNGQTLNNNMNGTALTGPQLVSWTQGLLDLGNVNGTVTFNFNVGNFQKCTPTAAVSVGFGNWPQLTGSGPIGYGVLRVWFNITNTAYTVTLPASVSVGVGDIAGFNASTNTITFDTPGAYVFDFSSTDGGNTYLIFDCTRNRATFRDPSFYLNNTVTPTLYVGYGSNGGGLTSLGTVLAGEQGQNSLSAFGSYNSAAVGNLSLGNTINPTLDTGKIGGYSITAARGNLAQSSIVAVKSGDYLGYINSVTYTGNAATGSGNVFQQTASIDFYAVGSNIAYGLGSNIAFSTRRDGGSGVSSQVVQALSINNDQTVEAIGNFQTDAAIIENGSLYAVQPTTGFSFTFANNSVSSYLIDAVGTISSATIILPSAPKNMQTVKIATTQPITTANIYAGSLTAVKGIGTATTSTVLSNATGSAVRLTYVSSVNAWVRS